VSLGDSVLDAIGNTPLVRLKRLSRGLRPWVYAKLEFMNPGGSVKDRIASYLVADAEKKGLLRKGGTIIEPTSGNTGVGLAMLAAVRGYKAIFTMPDKVSEEKRALLRAYGAKIVVAPTDLPPSSPEHYVNVAKRLKRETPRSYMPNQYENLANPKAHYATTGPEIWSQVAGRLTHFVAGVGTGGTISGISRFLKERNPAIRVIGVEPPGPIHGIEGLKHLPTALRPSTYDEGLVDETLRVETEDALEMQRRLAREEGLSVGASAGAAVWASAQVGRAHPGAVVVTILPDGGHEMLEADRS